MVGSLCHHFEDEVDSSLGRDVYGFRVACSAVFDCDDFFAGGGVFDCFYKDFNRVFFEFLFDDFECFLYNVKCCGCFSCLVTAGYFVFFSFVAGYHDAVDESFNDIGFGFVEAHSCVSGTCFGYDNGV